jgi:hypothetical protein
MRRIREERASPRLAARRKPVQMPKEPIDGHRRDVKALEILSEFEQTHKIKSAAETLDDRIRVGLALMRRRGMPEAASASTTRREFV